eukprot:Colp12_sorted_trinity150504_noHs@22282
MFALRSSRKGSVDCARRVQSRHSSKVGHDLDLLALLKKRTAGAGTTEASKTAPAAANTSAAASTPKPASAPTNEKPNPWVAFSQNRANVTRQQPAAPSASGAAAKGTQTPLKTFSFGQTQSQPQQQGAQKSSTFQFAKEQTRAPKVTGSFEAFFKPPAWSSKPVSERFSIAGGAQAQTATSDLQSKLKTASATETKPFDLIEKLRELDEKRKQENERREKEQEERRQQQILARARQQQAPTTKPTTTGREEIKKILEDLGRTTMQMPREKLDLLEGPGLDLFPSYKELKQKQVWGDYYQKIATEESALWAEHFDFVIRDRFFPLMTKAQILSYLDSTPLGHKTRRNRRLLNQAAAKQTVAAHNSLDSYVEDVDEDDWRFDLLQQNSAVLARSPHLDARLKHQQMAVIKKLLGSSKKEAEAEKA